MNKVLMTMVLATLAASAMASDRNYVPPKTAPQSVSAEAGKQAVLQAPVSTPAPAVAQPAWMARPHHSSK